MSNSKKVIVITGASQGLGAGMVKAFRDLDYRVVATSRSIKPSTDPDILTVAGDIGDPAIAERVIREAIARFGRIDTLVNNAGIFVAKPFTSYTHEDYAAVLSVNLNGFFYITQLAIAPIVQEQLRHRGLALRSVEDVFWMWRIISPQRLAAKLGMPAGDLDADDIFFRLFPPERSVYWIADRF